MPKLRTLRHLFTTVIVAAVIPLAAHAAPTDVALTIVAHIGAGDADRYLPHVPPLENGTDVTLRLNPGLYRGPEGVCRNVGRVLTGLGYDGGLEFLVQPQRTGQCDLSIRQPDRTVVTHVIVLPEINARPEVRDGDVVVRWLRGAPAVRSIESCPSVLAMTLPGELVVAARTNAAVSARCDVVAHMGDGSTVLLHVAVAPGSSMEIMP